MRNLLQRLAAALRPRGSGGPAGPTTVTRLPGPTPARYPVRPGRPLPALPPDIDPDDEQRIRYRIRHLIGEE